MDIRQKQDEKKKLPLICRMCKMGLVKYFCKVCPPVSANDLPMSEEEAHALNVQMRHDEEATGIISNVDDETLKYFADMRNALDSTASSGVDEQSQHSVAHNKSRQDEKCARDLSRAARRMDIDNGKKGVEK